MSVCLFVSMFLDIMRLLNNCKVNAGKYSDRSMTYGPNVVRSVQEAGLVFLLKVFQKTNV